MLFDHIILTFLLLAAALQFKHFVCDGPLQNSVMVISKSKYGDGWGVAHSLIHGVGTALVLFVFALPLTFVLGFAALDFVIHYHIDFCKENIVKRAGWTPQHSKFWWALSADQYLHQSTYVLLVWLVVKVS
jgi:Protein of unknown function (DUF3307)